MTTPCLNFIRGIHESQKTNPAKVNFTFTSVHSFPVFQQSKFQFLIVIILVRSICRWFDQNSEKRFPFYFHQLRLIHLSVMIHSIISPTQEYFWFFHRICDNQTFRELLFAAVIHQDSVTPTTCLWRYGRITKTSFVCHQLSTVNWKFPFIF